MATKNLEIVGYDFCDSLSELKKGHTSAFMVKIHTRKIDCDDNEMIHVFGKDGVEEYARTIAKNLGYEFEELSRSVESYKGGCTFYAWFVNPWFFCADKIVRDVEAEITRCGEIGYIGEKTHDEIVNGLDELDYTRAVKYLEEADKEIMEWCNENNYCRDSWDEIWTEVMDSLKHKAFMAYDQDFYDRRMGIGYDFAFIFTGEIHNYEQFMKFVDECDDPNYWIEMAIDSTKDCDIDISNIYEWIKKGALEFGEDSDFYDLAEEFCPDFYLEQLLQVSNDADCA